MKTITKLSLAAATIATCFSINAQTLSASSTTSPVTCFGDADGTISLTVSGGIAPYQFQWSNGGNSANLTNLEPGDYTVQITDANGAVLTKFINVDGPTEPLTIEGVVSHVTFNNGNNGSINSEVSGGSPFKNQENPYLYTWSTGASNKNIANLTAGFYTLTVEDRNACIASETFRVVQPKKHLKPSLSNQKDNINTPYPNPSVGSTFIEVDEEVQFIQLVNVNNGTVKDYTATGDILEISDLESGDYLIYFTYNDNTREAKHLKVIK